MEKCNRSGALLRALEAPLSALNIDLARDEARDLTRDIGCVGLLERATMTETDVDVAVDDLSRVLAKGMWRKATYTADRQNELRLEKLALHLAKALCTQRLQNVRRNSNRCPKLRIAHKATALVVRELDHSANCATTRDKRHFRPISEPTSVVVDPLTQLIRVPKPTRSGRRMAIGTLLSKANADTALIADLELHSQQLIVVSKHCDEARKTRTLRLYKHPFVVFLNHSTTHDIVGAR